VRDLLLAAQSARMLAQSARRAKLAACAIDGFADADTRRLVPKTLAIPPGAGDAEWLEAAERLAPCGKGHGLVYGSGIDTRPALVEALARGRRLLGNTPETLARVNTPRRFFALLDGLGIAYPETRFSPPPQPENWLLKPGCGEGGKGVGFAAKIRPATTQDYYQRHIPGLALSALFLADGNSARVVGFNTQWTARHDPGQPFLFAGAVNRAGLGEEQRSCMEAAANRLSAALGLVGLNSLDFVLDGENCWVLELNPRPSASMALYDEDFAQGLLKAHIAACLGEPPPPPERTSPVRAFRYLFAPQALTVQGAFQWPGYCADIPAAGTALAGGVPLCSLMAEGESLAEVERLLEARETDLLERLSARSGDFAETR